MRFRCQNKYALNLICNCEVCLDYRTDINHTNNIYSLAFNGARKCVDPVLSYSSPSSSSTDHTACKALHLKKIIIS